MPAADVSFDLRWRFCADTPEIMSGCGVRIGDSGPYRDVQSAILGIFFYGSTFSPITVRRSSVIFYYSFLINGPLVEYSGKVSKKNLSVFGQDQKTETPIQ